LEIGELHVEIGIADVGIGHCADGAVWAVVMPHERGEVTSSAVKGPEALAHVWLRFHPGEIARLFPSETISEGGATNLIGEMRRIANNKMNASWQAGGRAMIPEPKDLTVDIDTKGGVRRFFVVDTTAPSAKYSAAFEKRAIKPALEMTAEQAGQAFDQLWKAFDEKYAMFILRPEVDWPKLRDTYRPRSLASKTTFEFANVCAEMLRNLRDLHIWLTVGGENVPVFDRPRSANSHPPAHRAILGQLQDEGRDVSWAVTDDRIGFIGVHGWSRHDTPENCEKALEQMRNTRGLIVDVRLNGGGNEDLARAFASRFLKKEFTYAFSQLRNGTGHSNLTQKIARKISPGKAWRYDRPVILLIGQKCISSNESFIGMMIGDPEVTTMGDHTCGSSGNPTIINLPLEMTVSVPRWIDYLPDGSILDERGFQPQVLFVPSPGSFSGNRDDLLTAALERVRKLPLPEKIHRRGHSRFCLRCGSAG
jgi:hypothetical protein